MRAISLRMPDMGISTFSCSARLALRMRVSMSAIGSVIMCLSPAALGHAGDDALVGEIPEADPAHPELAVVRPRAATPVAAVVGLRRVLRGAVRLDYLRFSRHLCSRPNSRMACRAAATARVPGRRRGPSS